MRLEPVLALIGFKVAFLHTIAGTLVPLLVLAFMTRFFGANRSFVEGLRVWNSRCLPPSP